MRHDIQTEPAPVVRVGIDWADHEHVFHGIGPDGREFAGTFRQEPEEIERAVAAWRGVHPDAAVEIAVEQSRGPLINALLGHDGLLIFPVNPAKLACYRRVFAHGGGKNDPTDALRLAMFLAHYRDELRPLRQDRPLTRELAVLCEDRRGLVDRRTRLANELTAVLKAYFPCLLSLAAAKPYARFVIRFLLKHATLQEAQRAGRDGLRKLFQGVAAAKAESRIDTIMEARPLTEDPVVLRTSARRARALAAQIDQLNTAVAGYDDEIARLVKEHEDHFIVASLPGAADKTQARILAALGDDRSRYADAASLQAAAGIAPLTDQSGRQKRVFHRWACTKFMKQTFHEYAALSIPQSAWARAFYRLQLSRGKSPQAARRSLAYKWMRIIFRCWQDRVPYDEARYLQRLRETGSPLLKHLEN